MNKFWDQAHVIHTYTRSQAIADGVLIDVSSSAREAGITWPVALTAAAWVEAVVWDAENVAPQDEQGRLWDVLTMAHYAVRQGGDAHRRPFAVLRVPNSPTARRPLRTTLHLLSGPGDAGEPVLTITCPDED